MFWYDNKRCKLRTMRYYLQNIMASEIVQIRQQYWYLSAAVRFSIVRLTVLAIEESVTSSHNEM
jgi:hypothetical protein